jgi:hypothetical protein
MNDDQIRQALQGLRDALRRQQQQIGNVLSQLDQANKAQTAAIAAVNAKTQRVGTSLTNLATGLTTVTLTWPTVWPDTAYGVYTSLITGGAVLGQISATLVNATKAVDTVQIMVNNASGGVVASVGLDVLGDRT